MRLVVALVLAALAAGGCRDTTVAPRDLPAAPRGLYRVNGDGKVTLHWLANTEPYVAGYRVYVSPCANGPDCPFDRVGSTPATSYDVPLANGTLRYFAVAAYDPDGREGPLSVEDVAGAARPEGFGVVIGNSRLATAGSGWDFSARAPVAWNSPACDMYFYADSAVSLMYVPDPATISIQDMGYAGSLDAVGLAPPGGWSPSGSVEVIPGHNYVVWTRDDHYAKFRVTVLSPTVNARNVTFDWAYQTDPGDPQLRVRPAAGVVTPPAVAARPSGATAAVAGR